MVTGQRLPVTERATLHVATECMILPTTCSAVMTQLSTPCSPILALRAVSNPWILDTTIDERPNCLSLLQRLDACHVHLNPIVNLTVWLHGARSGSPMLSRPGIFALTGHAQIVIAPAVRVQVRLGDSSAGTLFHRGWVGLPDSPLVLRFWSGTRSATQPLSLGERESHEPCPEPVR
jgi:hypothetical protein